MRLSVGGVPDSEWTDEPKYQIDSNPWHTAECFLEHYEYCMLSWVNFEDTKTSTFWTVCTF